MAGGIHKRAFVDSLARLDAAPAEQVVQVDVSVRPDWFSYRQQWWTRHLGWISGAVGVGASGPVRSVGGWRTVRLFGPALSVLVYLLAWSDGCPSALLRDFDVTVDLEPPFVASSPEVRR